MADKKEEKKKGGCLRFFVFIGVLLVGLLGFLTYLSFDPQDLTDIDGYRVEASLIPPPGRNLGNVLAEAERGGLPATITEREINHYLIRTLKSEQQGLFAEWVKLEGVWVRLEDGVAEVIIERSIMDERKHTIAMHLEVEQEEEQDGQVSTRVNPTGGRFGRTQVVEGYLYLVLSSFEALAGKYDDELGSLKSMFENKARLEIKEGELVITPAES
ncbi:MAG: hypothetical protein HKN82_02780 [Akkermansiaceae bacterium]|nr:hypothetical protein [Akkermansiaceae bacterium]NNM29972.1 hypothetical protein [Akkermansiaceae bacterium]